MSPDPGGERPVVVVTGGGGGIGAAVATELGRWGAFVVTVDPLVTLDGSAPSRSSGSTTAERIVAAGGAARASTVSVTDHRGVQALLAGLVAEHGRLDAVINVAGITRPTSFTRGSEGDWQAVLEVHLDGYLNLLRAALPIMAAAGRGRVLGVTSGSGWRAADAGAYGCAKRAVAALTWQLGRVAPPGVTVAAVSPIAVTRMVTEALARSARSRAVSDPGGPPSAQERSEPDRSTGSGAPGRPGGPRSAQEPIEGSRATGSIGPGGPSDRSDGVRHRNRSLSASERTGGLSLGSMPGPAALGPLVAHLAVADAADWSRGRVVFAAGSEVALVDPPRLIEVLGTDGVPSLAGMLDAATPAVLAPAEATQTSTGGSNPRLPTAPAGATEGSDPPDEAASGSPSAGVAGPGSVTRRCLVVSDRPEVDAVVAAALGDRGIETVTLSREALGRSTAPPSERDVTAASFADAARIVGDERRTGAGIDAVVVVPPARTAIDGTADGRVAGSAIPTPGGAAPPNGPTLTVVGPVGPHEGDPMAPVPSGATGVTALGGGRGDAPLGHASGWGEVLADHDGLADDLLADAAWSRAVADAAGPERDPVRLVTLVDARSAGGCSRAQAATQLARAARRATDDRVASFVVAMEGTEDASIDVAGELTAHLLAHPEAVELSGAELVVADGWCGLRSHPRPGTGVVVGGPEVPAWFDDVMRSVADAR